MSKQKASTSKASSNNKNRAAPDTVLFAQQQFIVALQKVAKISTAVSRITNPKEVLQTAVDCIQDEFNFYYVQICLLNKNNNTLEMVAGTGKIGQQIVAEKHTIPVDKRQSLIAQAMRTEQAVIVNNTLENEAFLPQELLSKTHSEMAIPIIGIENAIGILDIQSEQKDAFVEADIQVQITLATQLGPAYQNAIQAEQVRQSQLKYRSILETVADGYYETNLKGDLLFFNDTLASIFGFDNPEELQGVNYKTFTTEENAEKLFSAFNQAFESREPVPSLEYTQLCEDGTTRLIDLSVACIFNDAGEVTGFSGLGKDVTEKRLAETKLTLALEETERQAWRLTLLNELSSALTRTTTLEEVYGTVGAYVLEIIAGDQLTVAFLQADMKSVQVYDLQDDKGIIPTDTFLPVNGTAAGYAINENKILRLPRDGSLEQYPDSSQMQYQGMQSVVFIPISASGRIIGTLNLASKEEYAYTGMDINLFKQIGSLFASAIESRRLDEQARLLASIVENHPDFIGVRSIDGNTVYINPAGLRMIHLPSNYDVTHIDVANLYSAEDTARLTNEGIPTAMEQGSWSAEVELRQTDGQVIPVEETVGINYDATGKPTSVSITMRDITVQKEAEKILTKQAAELEIVTEVGATSAQTLDPEALTQAVVDLTKERFDLYHAHIYLIDEQGAYLNLAAGAGEVGEQMVKEQHSILLQQTQSLVARAAQAKQGIMVRNVYQEPTFLPNPLLPNTQAEIAVPIMLGEVVTGVLDVQSEQVNSFTENDLRVYTVLASQIAVALQNSRLFSESESARQELDELTRRLTREGWETYLQTKDVVAMYEDESIEDTDPLSHLEQSLLVQGEAIGHLSFTTPTALNEDDSDMITAVAERLSLHIENLRLAEQTELALSSTEEQARRLALLSEMGDALNMTPSVSDAFDVVATKTIEILQAQRASITMLVDPETLEVMAVYGDTNSAKIGSQVPLAETPMQKALTENRMIKGFLSGNEEENSNALFAPLVVNGRPLGTINIARPPINPFQIEESNIFLQIASLLSSRLENLTLLTQARTRAERERQVRTITDKIRRAPDRERILHVAREEIGRMLGAKQTAVHLGTTAQLKQQLLKRKKSDDTSTEET